MNVNNIILLFKEYIENNWSYVFNISKMLGEDEFTDDALIERWLQANWELIVENYLSHTIGHLYLTPYGWGAECYDDSSRVYQPTAVATHKIYCSATQKKSRLDLLTGKNHDVNELSFHRFVSWEYEKYGEDPPYNCVFLEDKENEYIFYLEDLDFILKKV